MKHVMMNVKALAKSHHMVTLLTPSSLAIYKIVDKKVKYNTEIPLGNIRT